MRLTNMPANLSTRSWSSAAARSVKVMAAMLEGGRPAASSMTTRPARSEVLPVPADASTRSVESRTVSARCSCIALADLAAERQLRPGARSSFRKRLKSKSGYPSRARTLLRAATVCNCSSPDRERG